VDDSQFDSWTRRRVGIGGVGLLLSLLGLAEQRAVAKGKKGKKGGPKKKKKKSMSGCAEDGQLCREDWGAYCTEAYESPEAEQCIAATDPCCDLYALCKIDAAITCEDNIEF
jgi:hypothetical protein